MIRRSNSASRATQVPLPTIRDGTHCRCFQWAAVRRHFPIHSRRHSQVRLNSQTHPVIAKADACRAPFGAIGADGTVSAYHTDKLPVWSSHLLPGPFHSAGPPTLLQNQDQVRLGLCKFDDTVQAGSFNASPPAGNRPFVRQVVPPMVADSLRSHFARL